MLVSLSTQIVADDPIEERQIAKEKQLIVQEYNCTNWACMVLTGDYKL